MALTGAAVVILDRRQMVLARRIQAALPGAAIHGPASLDGAADGLYERLVSHLPALFRAGTPIVGVCASGILIRLLAPHLADKHTEPPVIAVSEDGESVVPLLGGHHGANRLARTIADALGAHAAITTAGDTALGFALDAPPPGWRLGEGARVKEVTAALLAGEPVRLAAEAASADWLTAGGAPCSTVPCRSTRQSVKGAARAAICGRTPQSRKWATPSGWIRCVDCPMSLGKRSRSSSKTR